MLPRNFTLILTFYLILPESRDLLDFYYRISKVYNIMLFSFDFKAEIPDIDIF